MVEEAGAAELTLRGLAQRLGCSHANPYRYYRDKAGLLDPVRGRAFERLAEHVRDLMDAGIEPLGAHYVRFALENPEAYRVMFDLRQDFVSDETRAAQRRAWDVCALPIRKAVERGELVGDPEVISHVAWAALHGLASLALANQLHLGKSLAEVLEAFPAVLDGFRPAARAS